MIESVELTVTGMKCGGCEANVTDKLAVVNGVTAVKADFKANLVGIDYDPEQTTLDSLKQTITEAGFTVTD